MKPNISKKPDRDVLNGIAVLKSVKPALEFWQEEIGQPQVQVLARILDWFSQQDEYVQRTIVGHLGPFGADIARLTLARESMQQSYLDMKDAAAAEAAHVIAAHEDASHGRGKQDKHPRRKKGAG